MEKSALKLSSDRDPQVSKLLREYRDELEDRSLAYEDMVQSPDGGSPSIASIEIDGELVIAKFEKGEVRIYNPHGSAIEDTQVTGELAEKLSKKGVESAVLIGELYAVDGNGSPMPMNDSHVVMESPKDVVEERSIRLALFDIYKWNGKAVEEFAEEGYWKRYLLLEDFIGDGKYVQTFASKLSADKVADFWKRIDKGLAEGLVLREKDDIKVDPLNPQNLLVIGVDIDKHGHVGGLILAYLGENDTFYHAGRVHEGISEAEKPNLREWARRNRISSHEDTLFVNPHKEPLIAKVLSDSLLVAPRRAYRFRKNHMIDIGDHVSAVGKNPRLVSWEIGTPVKPDEVGLSQIPGYNKSAEGVKIAPKILPKAVLDGYIQKYGTADVSGLINYGLELYNKGETNKLDAIREWFLQDGWKVGITDSNFLVTDGSIVYQWTPKLKKTAVTDTSTTPFWISDVDALEDTTLNKDDSYQIRQYPFMSPSSRGMEIYFDQESPKEKLHEVKWLGVNAGQEDEYSENDNAMDFRNQRREVDQDDFYTGRMYGPPLERGYPWFIYMRGPHATFPPILQLAVSTAKEGKLEEIKITAGPGKEAPNLNPDITPEVTPKTTYPVSPLLSTTPGGAIRIFPGHPYFWGTFPSIGGEPNVGPATGGEGAPKGPQGPRGLTNASMEHFLVKRADLAYDPDGEIRINEFNLKKRDDMGLWEEVENGIRITNPRVVRELISEAVRPIAEISNKFDEKTFAELVNNGVLSFDLLNKEFKIKASLPKTLNLSEEASNEMV
jgi:hypothetical protein